MTVNGHGTTLTAAGASQAIVTAGGHTFTAVDAGKSVVLKDGTSTVMIKDGSHTTFDGQSISIGPHGSAVVVNGKTTSLSRTSGPASTQAIITAGGEHFTAVDKSGSVILSDASSTITVKDGQTTTFDGQKISVLPNGSAVVVNGKTTSLTSAAATTTTGAGHYIAHGIGGGGSGGSSSTPGTNAAELAAGLPAVKVLGGVVLGLLSILAIL